MSHARPAAEVGRLFLRLGVTAFGGPAAHIALMHDEIVRRRGWLDDQQFLDVVGATNLIPGPNSTEVAIHVGQLRAGWRGLLAAGVAFALPATVIVLGLAWAYVEFGTTPAAEGVLAGVAAVVIAIIAQALLRLSRTAVVDVTTAVIAVAAFAAVLLGVNELVALAVGALVGFAARELPRAATPAFIPFALAAAATDVTLLRLFGVFLKAGAVLYGSGYVLLAFIEGDLVDRLGWLTREQLLDAVAVGQVTPGPLSTTATFVGYVVADVPGALVATFAMFLPSFVFVALLARIVPAVRRSPRARHALDGVNAASLGLMGAVLVVLGGEALDDIWAIALAVIAGLVLWRTRVSSVWIIAGGAAVGLVSSLVA